MKVKTKNTIPELVTILAVTKLGICEVGYVKDNQFRTNRGLKYNSADILAWVDISDVETEFQDIYQKYIDKTEHPNLK